MIIDIGLIRLFCAILIYQNFRLFDNAAIYFFVYFFVILCLYYFIMELTLGKTIGKFFTGTKVVNLNGGKPNSSEIAIRTLCRFIPFELFTFLNKN